MSKFISTKAEIAGVVCGLPKRELSAEEIAVGISPEQVAQNVKTIGTEKFFWAAEGQKTSQLLLPVAEELLHGAGWQPAEVDGLLVLTRTPDCLSPALSQTLQSALGLPATCLTMDINQGCAAFSFGYATACSLIESGACSKVLLLIGDVLSPCIDRTDPATAFIMSDAASAVCVQRADGVTTHHILGGDGNRADILKIDGTPPLLYMDGMAVFDFMARTVPPLIDELLEFAKTTETAVDYFLLHQANQYMVRFIGRRAKIPAEKTPVNITKYSNTHGSAIAFLLYDLFAEKPPEKLRLLISSFGIGLSFGACLTQVGSVRCAKLIRI